MNNLPQDAGGRQFTPLQLGLVTINAGTPVTTTLAIAAGTENEHASVILLVRKYQEDLEEFGLLDFKSESSGGRPTEFAYLNEPQAALLMTYMRNSDIVRVFKKSLVKAFFELASRAQHIDPRKLTRTQILMMALEAEAEVAALTCKVEILEPKAEALDRLCTADGSHNITTAAKVLDVRPKDLFKFLSENQWIYRRAGGSGWVGYQDRIQSGLLDHKVTTIQRPDGSEKNVVQVLVTAKGLAKLSTLLRGAA